MTAFSQKPETDAKADPPKRLDDVIKIATPEKISFEYEMAGPVRRLLAWMTDLFVIQAGYWAMVLAIGFLILIIAGFFEGVAGGMGLGEIFAGLTLGLILVGAFLITWFYGAWAESVYNGQTIGKRWFELRVLSRDGGGINSGQALLRNFLRYADLLPFVPAGYFFSDPAMTDSFAIPVPTLMVGLISMVLIPGFRRLGDVVAGTIVVSERLGVLPNIRRFDDPRVAQLAELLPVSFVVSRTLNKSLAFYVDQRLRLGPDRCAEISKRLGTILVRQMGLAEDTNHDLLLCSLYYRTFRQQESATETNARTKT